MSHQIPEDAQRLADRLRMAADEIESAARYGVPIPSCVSVGGHLYSDFSFAATEDEFTAWAEYTEATVDHGHHHGADWSSAEVHIGDGGRLPLRFSVRHDAAAVSA